MISIIIPVYNAANTVRDTLDSVLNQTYTDFEVIMADDRSTDESYGILCEYEKKDHRFRVARNEKNSGAAATRNNAVRLARGEYVAFLDADDMWEPEKLQEQLKTVERFPESLIWFTGSSFISADGEKKASVLHVPDTIGRKKLLKQNVISCSSVIVRRETALQHPFPEGSDCHEDYATWLSILASGGVASGLDEPLLIYRLGAGKSANKLKAAVMNWRTYQVAGLSFGQKLCSMTSYAIRSVRKYASILLKGNSR